MTTTNNPADDPAAKPRKRRGASGGQGSTRSHSASSPEALARIVRDQRALQMRRQGALWDEIARASHGDDWPKIAGQSCGYPSAGTAYKQVMGLVRELPMQDAAEWRAILTDRCEAVIRAMLPRVLDNSTDNAAKAANVVLRACNQLRQMYVPDLPKSVEVTVVSEFEEALRDLHAELAAKAAVAKSRVPAE